VPAIENQAGDTLMRRQTKSAAELDGLLPSILEKALDDDALRETLKARALDIGRRDWGRFAEYDLNNEMLHGNYYEQRLGPNITRDMALWMRHDFPEGAIHFTKPVRVCLITLGSRRVRHAAYRNRQKSWPLAGRSPDCAGFQTGSE
jgi:hypothetical protein